MSRDYHYQEVAEIDEITGYPKDRWGHLLSKEDKNNDGEHVDLTSPYGALYFAVGNGDDFVCFDYAILDQCKDGKTRIALHATVNSETGSFIDGFGYEVCELGEAANVALGMIDQAVDWCYMDPESMVEHDKDGWNQDEYYFYRSVFVAEQELLNVNTPDFSEKEMRFGGEKISEYVGLSSLV